MPTVYPTATGNYSTRTWNDDSTGAAYGPGTPQAGDTILTNGTTLTMDQNVTVALIRNIAGTNAVAGGSITFSGTRTHSFNLQAGATDIATCAFDSNTTLTGNVTGGSSANADGISATSSTVTLSVLGNVTGGSAAAANGIVMSSSSGSLSITGVATGGTNATAYGINKSGTSTLTLTGNIVSNTANGANITGGVCTLNSDLSALSTVTVLSISGATAKVTLNVTSGTLTATKSGAMALVQTNAVLIVNANVAGGGATNWQALSISAAYCRINGNVTGGTAVNTLAVQLNTGICVVVGNVSGNSAATTYGINTTGTPVIVIEGNVTGGSAASAINIDSSSPATGSAVIYGTVTGGSGAGAFGISNAGDARCYIFGTEVAGVAAAKSNTGSGSITTVAVGGGGSAAPRHPFYQTVIA